MLTAPAIRPLIAATAPERSFTSIALLARSVTESAFGSISFVGGYRVWSTGAASETVVMPRTDALCAYARREPTGVLDIGDMMLDTRFGGQTSVLGSPAVRSYTGLAIGDGDGVAVGTLCVLDVRPRALTSAQLAALALLRTMAEELLTLSGLVRSLDRDHRRVELFERGFELAAIGKQLVDRTGRLLRVNPAFEAMIGRDRAELVGRYWWQDCEAVSPDALSGMGAAPLGPRDTSPRSGIWRYRHRNGSTLWAQVNVVPVTEAGGELISYVQITDITETIDARDRLREVVAALQQSQERLNSLIMPSPDLVMLLSDDGEVLAANPAAAALLAPAGPALVGRRLAELGASRWLLEDLVARIAAAIRTGMPEDIDRVWIEPDVGDPGWFRVRIVPVHRDHGSVGTAFLSAVDVTAAVTNEGRLAALALIDPLTGAANRASLYDRLDVALARLERDSRGTAVAMIDLDHFKALNDTYGHDTGDAALVSVVNHMRPAVRSQDSVARIGGDEFVVMFDNVTEAEATEHLAPRLAEQLRDVPVSLEAATVHIGGSLGLAWTGTRIPIAELLGRADRALRQAKRHGRGRLWVAEENASSVRHRFERNLRRDLASALARDQFRLHYQPIVDRDGRPTAVEALLRWQHPEHGLLQPAGFMGGLIESGLIAPVGQWVIRQAIADLETLQQQACIATMHINLSPGECAGTRAVAVLRDVLAETDVAPQSVVIEVTEQALMGTVVSSSSMTEIVSTGVRLALDDFGTGSSSLTHLRHHSLHGLKLDRSFVAGIATSDTDTTILSGTISIARRLGLDVVAEGVETELQRDWLLAEGCTHLQGWLTGRPVELATLIAG